MSEITPGRRWLGRGLIVTAASLALPLTASISYSVALAQQPVQPAQPAPVIDPAAPIAAIDPDAPEAPAAPVADRREMHTVFVSREGADGEPVVRRFSFDRHAPGPAPNVPMPNLPQLEFDAWGDRSDPEFARKMEEWSEQMEQWSEDYGEQWEQWAEQQGAQALAWSEQARRNAPEVVHSCDPAERGRRTTADGRPRVVICQDVQVRVAAQAEARARAQALSSLRRSRNAIAANGGMSDEVRREVLDDLDDEIRRMERGED